jgi:hypothetical protein
MNKRVLAIASALPIALVGFWLIFDLPYLVPLLRRTVSLSYVVGFNNGAAVFGVIVVIAMLVVQRAIFHSYDPTAAFTTNDEHHHSGKVIYVYLALAFLYCITTIGLVCLVQDSFYGEAAYFIRKMDLVLMGLQPYRDFEFAYGPALIYFPAVFHAVFGNAGLSTSVSYYTIYGLANLLGLYLLYYTINSIVIKERYKAELLVVLGLVYWPVIVLGLNYTFLRFITAYACLMFIHRYLVSARKPSGTSLTLFALSAGSALVNLSISPEIGLAYSLTLLLYLGYFASTSAVAERVRLLKALPAAPIAVVAFMSYPGYFQSMLSVGSGAYNFPLVPAPHILLYLLGIFLVVPSELASAIKEKSHVHALAFAYSLLIIFTIPGALGRSDFGHVLWYGIGVFLMVPVILSKRSRSHVGAWVLSFFVLFTCYQFIHFRIFYGAAVTSAALEKSAPLYDRAKVESQLRSLGGDAQESSGSDRRDANVILTPLGSDVWFDKYLKSTGRMMSPERSMILKKAGLY